MPQQTCPQKTSIKVLSWISAAFAIALAVWAGVVRAEQPIGDASAATFQVRSSGDLPDENPGDGECSTSFATISGPCTLRAAIQEANATAAADVISFAIPIDAGAPTITVSSELPAITAPVTIDGTTQAGGLVQLTDDQALSSSNDGLILAGSGGSTVRGLVINGFRGNGILITSANNIVEGCRIGTTADGSESFPNYGSGVLLIGPGANGNRIGGITAAAQNIISGNFGAGVSIVNDTPSNTFGVNTAGAASGNLIQGNLIGTNSASARLGNGGPGVSLIDATNTTIGGTEPGARNVISSNAAGEANRSSARARRLSPSQGGFAEISINGPLSGGAAGNLVQGNYIGVNVAGDESLSGFADGISIFHSTGNTIGGTVAAARNVISGNARGIVIDGSSNNLVQGNFIGTNAAGTGDLGNYLDGVFIFSRLSGVSPPNALNNQIGGTTPGAGNVIAYNGVEVGNGVTVIFIPPDFLQGSGLNSALATTGNSILGNSIFENDGLGIDLDHDGVTPNDPADPDPGANNLQNYPALTSVVSQASGTRIRGTLNSAPNATFRIEFFLNRACDRSGYGQGQRFFNSTSVTTDANGVAVIDAAFTSVAPVDQVITATATDSGGNTSEFSGCVSVSQCPVYPIGFVPFTSVNYISEPDAMGDRVLVGVTPIEAIRRINSELPHPAFENEEYCTEVPLAPGYLARAYVPSERERLGDFSQFGRPIIDPISNQPFPSNIIPLNRLGNPYVWRVKSIRQNIADLAVTQTASPSPILVNNLLTYTITVVNKGPTTATNVRMFDILPRNVDFGSAGPTQGSCSRNSGGVPCNLGTLQPGASATVTIIVTVRSTLVGDMTNVVEVMSDQSDPNPDDNTVRLVTRVDGVANLVVTKRAEPLTPGPGEDLKYTITVANTGPNNAIGVSLVDNIPANTTFKSVTAPEGWSCAPFDTPAGRAITCGTGALDTEGVRVFELVVTVNNNTPKDTVITNTAQATSTTFDSDYSNNSATAVVRTGGPQTRIVTGGTIEVGPIQPLREPSRDPANGIFALENTGSSLLALTPTSLLRLAPDAGKLTPPADDRSLFDVRYITSEGDVPLTFGPNGVILVSPQQTLRFRVLFNPIIPMRAGKTSGLAANQVLPETVNSRLTLTSQTGQAVGIDLIGRVSPLARLIHPLDPRRAPQVTLTQSGGTHKVEAWVYDPNLNVYLVRYEFLNSSGGQIGDPVDVLIEDALASANLARGQVFGVEQDFEGVSGVANVRVTIYDRDSAIDSAVSGAVGAVQAAFASVSAASFNEFGLSAESIAAGFGLNLNGRTELAANNPLPTSLAGASVMIRDGAGIERSAPLFFVSPGQINYQLPSGLSPGTATVSVFNGDRLAAIGAVRVANTWPGIFAADGNGQGVAAAVALRVKPDGTQSYEPVAQFDPALQRYVAAPINFGDESDQLYLVFFGTGLRNRSSLERVSVKLGGIDAPVLFAGAQPGFSGLDQINVAVPASFHGLQGRGELDVVVTVDGYTANVVRVSFGSERSTPAAATQQSLNVSLPNSVIVTPRIKLSHPVVEEKR